ncbi:MAG: hypothetical protein QW782_04015 [Candidatus Bathyarchaeia archaeon]
MSVEVEEFKPCITWRTMMALIVGALVIAPAIIYSQLTIGGSLGLVSSWLIVLLWAELARLMGNPLTRQEVLILQNFSFVALWAAALFILPGTWAGIYGLIWRIYFVNSPVIYEFGLEREIPWWFAPPKSSPLVLGYIRSLFHVDLLVPLVILLAVTILSWLMNISLGFLCYQIFVARQRLDYPLQAATAIGVISIAEHGPTYKPFMVAAALGAIFGLPGPLLGSITGGVLGGALGGMQAISLNVALEQVMPGASFGILIDVFALVAGLLLDPKVVLAMAIPAYAAYLVGNHLLVRFGIWPSGGLEMGAWMPGASEGYCIWWSQIRFWTSVQFGLSIVGAIAPFIVFRKTIIDGLKSLRSLGVDERREGLISLKWIIITYIVSSSAIVAITSWITPEFPWYLNALFTIGWSFMATLVASASAGLTSSAFNIPYFKQAVISLAGVKPNLNLWFAPLELMNTGGAGWVGNFRMARMCRIRLTEYVLAYFISFVLGVISGLIFASIFWGIAPIPSGAYPHSMISWTNQAYWQLLFLKWFERGIVLKPDIIMFSIITGIALYALLAWRNMAILYYAIIVGISLPGGYGVAGSGAEMYDALPMLLLGSIIGKYILAKKASQSWGVGKYAIASGLSAGYSIMGTISAAFSLILKAQWVLPY